jgi:hydrogenase-4 component B
LIDKEAIMGLLQVMALSITPGLPLLLALSCCLPPFRKQMQKLLPLAAAPALAAGLFVPGDLLVSVPWFFMGGRMGLDDTSRIFLFSSAAVWLLAGFALSREKAEAEGRHVLFSCFLASMAGNFGLILAQEMLGFYLFFALMSFSVYGLVVFHKTRACLRAGRIYIIMVMISEVALFTAMALLAKEAKSFAFADLVGISCPPAVLLLLYVGLGTKIGALPLHIWMIPTYKVTPPAATAALAGAMVNAGILGWLKLLFPLQPVLPQWALFFIMAGVLAVFMGVLLGLSRREPGAVLAGSSISQMGIATLIIGGGLLTPELKTQAAAVLTLFVVHHAFAKSSLFLGYNALGGQRGKLKTSQLAALLLPALSLAGLPLTSGAITKTGLHDFWDNLQPPWHGMAAWFLPASSVATTLLVLHFVRLCCRENTEDSYSTTGGYKAWYVSVALAAITFWVWPASRAAFLHSLLPEKFWNSFWPVLAGGLLTFGWNRPLVRKISKRLSPFGTITGSPARHDVPVRWQTLHHHLHLLLESDLRLLHQGRNWWRHAGIDGRLKKMEKIFSRWIVVGLFYLTLTITLLALL